MIICFGGAFNPPTKAHLEIYHAVKKAVIFNRFIYMPASDHYSKPLVSASHRIEMLKLMTKDLEDVMVDSYETDLEMFKGTYHTLNHLKASFDEKVVYLCGVDQVLTLDSWIMSKALKEEFDFIILTRPGYDLLKVKKIMTPYQIIEMNASISSSAFRETQEKELLVNAVYDYIKKHHLYEEPHV
jgi:nicotinate-nucleotide adenylyltransferase